MDSIKLPTRAELTIEDTWDLTRIFPSDEAFEQALDQINEAIDQYQQNHDQIDHGATSFLRAIEQTMNLFQQGTKIYSYASLKHDQDTGNAKYQVYSGQATTMFAKLVEAASWLEPAILSLPSEKITEYLASNEQLKIYHHYLEQLLDKKDHVNSPEIEALLAKAGDALQASSETFGFINNTDLKFGEIVNADGVSEEVTHGNLIKFLKSTDRTIRQNAFEKVGASYQKFEHTLASTLNGEVKAQVLLSQAHHYPTVRAASLAQNHIPETVYDTLVATVNDHLPLLHRYVELRKKVLKLKELHSYDLYVPLMGEPPLKYTYSQAKEVALLALAPLGTEYLNYLRYIFDHRVIDVYENQGKRSGAYSGGSYDTDPYILLNWQDGLGDLKTLVHESGHSVHSHFSRTNQPYVYGDYSIFVAEIASTTNENILTEYLLKTESEPMIRSYLLNDYLEDFKGSVFRQTQFAEFEQYFHHRVEEGTPLIADDLNQSYAELNQRYYGSALSSDPQIAVEWARIPHFYYNYYVFQYATGFAAAQALANKIVTGTTQDVENYLNYLRSGDSDYPLAVMKKAGVDMSNATYLENAFATFEKRLNELEQILGS